MIVEIKIPGAGESVTEAAIGNWLVEDGAMVEKDQEIAEVETDKATLPLIASDAGKIKIIAGTGEKIGVGQVACTIDTEARGKPSAKKADDGHAKTSSSPAAATAEEHVQPTRLEPPPVAGMTHTNKPETAHEEKNAVKITPLAKNIMNDHEMDVQSIIDGLKKITKSDVEQVIKNVSGQSSVSSGTDDKQQIHNRSEERIPMSPLRRKLGKRLVQVKNETAMLTTFNEVDMSAVLELRKKYQNRFQEKHQQKLGLMSFFIKATSKALRQFPGVNSFIDNEDIVTPNFIDIAVAVQTEKGLMVPVIRNADQLSLAHIESQLSSLAEKARSYKLSLEEMTGGTFTITNGGIFGSMLSTPIINPPQSAILGMHNIVERPVAVNGKVEIKPIMYVALSYDHRIIDGRESVTFLVKIKELIESPVKMLIDGNPEQLLLDL